MLLDPRQVEQGPDGNIYVLDAGDSYLKVYAPAGDFIGQIAGEGEGPGMFQRVDGATFGFSPDGLSRVFTIFDSQGNQVRVVETGLPDPVPVSRPDLDKWRGTARDMLMSYNRAWYENFGRVIEKYRDSLYDKPNLVRLSTTPGGRILVEGPAATETGPRDYWLLIQGAG